MDNGCLIRGSVARNWHGILGVVQRGKPNVSKHGRMNGIQGIGIGSSLSPSHHSLLPRLAYPRCAPVKNVIGTSHLIDKVIF